MTTIPEYFRADAFEDDNPSKLRNAFTADWLMAQEFPAVNYVVDGIIPEGLTLLIAAPKIGKSWMVLGLAMATSTGSPALGCVPTKAAPVLYMALEDGPRRLQSRMKVLNVRSVSSRLTFITQVPRGDMLATIREFMDRHPGENPVVILDTLGKAMPPAVGGETQYDRDYRVLGGLKALADNNPGSSVIIVHHTRKMDGADFLDAVSGTQGIAGAADTIMLLKRSRHESQASLQVTSRDAAEGEYILEQAGTGNWVLAGGSRAEAAKAAMESRSVEGVDTVMADVIAAVNQTKQDVTPAQVSALVGSIDGKRAGTYLARAADAGRIRKTSRGKYASVNSVESVESGNEDLDDFPQFHTFHTPTDQDGEAA
ncbi:helicase RepA family protein [Arthrobacter sp. CJ23]|uniref:AAA family ATPase n=1 Tax=Arthrobacter sp. CJ23 TaxID=2972479 RepID=UPI00215C7CF7|nr:helicase RepA family protein [Arthrobacter sp. CJ23]UVJ40249.1 helicase RepA family protein [Arthrobacter sp. CJ23]